jgi:hypothetical protein
MLSINHTTHYASSTFHQTFSMYITNDKSIYSERLLHILFTSGHKEFWEFYIQGRARSSSSIAREYFEKTHYFCEMFYIEARDILRHQETQSIRWIVVEIHIAEMVGRRKWQLCM